MEAADSLHRDDRALQQGLGGGGDRVDPGGVVGAEELHARPALRARVRLGVKTAIARILVLAQARRAHLEAGHGRERPVIRDPADDGEARAAVGAVRERIAKAAVLGIEQLRETVGAGGAVGGDRGARLAVTRALTDDEPDLPRLRHRLGGHALDVGQRRRLRLQPGEEALDRLRLRLHLHDHAARVVEDVPGHSELTGQPVDVGPEAHPLDRALHARAYATHPVTPPAPAARGTRWPAPPGCAGCAPSA